MTLGRAIMIGFVVVIVSVASGELVAASGSDYIASVATTVAMWIALSASWIVLSGMTGYISLGHAVFFGLGGYTMALTWGVMPMGASIILAGAVAALLAIIIGYPCLRVRGPYFVILTFGVSEFVKFIVINIEASLGKFGRLVVGAPSVLAIFYVMLGLGALAFLLAWTVRRSRFGAGLLAIRADEEAAETVGVPVRHFKTAAFVLSAVLPGMAGAVDLLRSGYFEPLQSFSPLISLTIIATAVIGGSDDAPGPLMGALFLVILSELLLSSAPEIYKILLGLLLILFVLWVPDGIHGRLQALTAGRRS